MQKPVYFIYILIAFKQKYLYLLSCQHHINTVSTTGHQDKGNPSASLLESLHIGEKVFIKITKSIRPMEVLHYFLCKQIQNCYSDYRIVNLHDNEQHEI